MNLLLDASSGWTVRTSKGCKRTGFSVAARAFWPSRRCCWVGTDIDVQALEASRDNAGRNHIAAERFPLYLPQDLPAQQADVLVANILAGPLVSLAPQLTTLVKTGGRLALSGILAEQGEEVAAAYAENFELDPIANRDGWVRITGRRR